MPPAPWRPAAAGARLYRMKRLSLPLAALLGLAAPPAGAVKTETLQIGGGALRVVIPDAESDAAARRLAAWVRDNARAVAAYYHGFPVAEVEVRIFLEKGSSEIHAKT